jgi:hypothetical protein
MPSIRTTAVALLRSPATRRLLRCLLGCALAALAAPRPADLAPTPPAGSCR